MCGIGGVVVTGGDSSASMLEHLARAMAAGLARRGPDAEGLWFDPDHGVALAHRRLKIIDLSERGAQPMRSASSRYVLTYNGELYNHDELRRRLERRGHRFRGTSDTEVLLNLIEDCGVRDAIDHLDGMFAFGVWDRRARELSLARDRFGEKPLYYGHHAGRFAFASDIGSLRAGLQASLTVDPSSIADLLRFKFIPAPWTVYEGVYKLPPASLLTVSRSAPGAEPQRYWNQLRAYEDAVGDPFTGSLAEATTEAEQRLRASVRSRLTADVPVGALLSGGIDSSVIVALAQAERAAPVQTFTVGTAERDFDERPEARAIASALGTDHHELVVDAADLRGAVESLPVVYDEPFADSSQIPTLLVSRFAARSVKVVLSGDGGDELFGGYNRYAWLPGMWARASRCPAGLRAAVARSIERVPVHWWDVASRALPEAHRPRQLGLKARKVARVGGARSPSELYGQVVSHWPEPQHLIGHHEHSTLATSGEGWPQLPFAQQMMAVDIAWYLPDDILVKLDRATMSVGLEARAPFLSPAVYDLACRLPMAMKIRGGETKVVLRELRRRLIPSGPAPGPKTGFGIPLGAWLRGPLRGWAEEVLFDGGPLPREALRPLWEEHQAGRADHAYLLWDVLVLNSSLELLVDGAPAADLPVATASC